MISYRTALKDNHDLQLAVARVAEARALLGVGRSAQYPELNGGTRYDDRVSETSYPPVEPGLIPNMDGHRADRDASFEVDLWGRVRRATEPVRCRPTLKALADHGGIGAYSDTVLAEFATAGIDIDDLAVNYRMRGEIVC